MPLDNNTVIMEYKHGSIKAKDVAQLVQPQLDQLYSQLKSQRIDMYKNAANQLLMQTLIRQEATKQSVAVEKLLQKEMV